MKLAERVERLQARRAKLAAAECAAVAIEDPAGGALLFVLMTCQRKGGCPRCAALLKRKRPESTSAPAAVPMAEAPRSELDL